ncbi:M20/M25/M40 family metallo-hydrolase [Paracoccus caeni]|uniref:M20/M25/M40 family metallo-hydrolase n=1 Tax=Paracoccus caeni TaxID=657651 RepID=A0A934SF89_9RHOB|nr:M20/M25/M40 family metallo-hydrolase [Paracoccus caeni]MBK4216792.1 M20/M25/M40 family metallo-hydrolase [Paracoccus caeni]
MNNQSADQTDLTPRIESVLAEVARGEDAAIRKLLDLIAIPSVSSEAPGSEGIARAAIWLRDALEDMGLQARIVETEGHPVVLGASDGDGSRPRMLFYGHYDVQPTGPLTDWTHPPFAPTILDEDGLRRFYGRGASDSKSQLWTFLEALRAWKTVHGAFPAEIVVLLEGEEESGSASLPDFIARHRDDLRCDIAFICDGDMWSREQPAITTQLKGLVHEKVTIHTPHSDLHSGYFGPVAANPIRILSGILAGIHDADGRIAIEGFYDDVQEIPDKMRDQWRHLSASSDVTGGVSLEGGVIERGYSTLEAMWGRPTVDINGITGGNQGPTGRSVLPGTAHARLTFRLVAGQDPDLLRARFHAFVRARVPAGCRAEFEGEGYGPAIVLSQDNPYLHATARGFEAEWGNPTVLKGTGGAIPLVHQLHTALSVDCIVVGFILGSDAIHGPDEHYDVERFGAGVRAWVRAFAEYEKIE